MSESRMGNMKLGLPVLPAGVSLENMCTDSSAHQLLEQTSDSFVEDQLVINSSESLCHASEQSKWFHTQQPQQQIEVTGIMINTPKAGSNVSNAKVYSPYNYLILYQIMS